MILQVEFDGVILDVQLGADPVSQITINTQPQAIIKI